MVPWGVGEEPLEEGRCVDRSLEEVRVEDAQIELGARVVRARGEHLLEQPAGLLELLRMLRVGPPRSAAASPTCASRSSGETLRISRYCSSAFAYAPALRRTTPMLRREVVSWGSACDALRNSAKASASSPLARSSRPVARCATALFGLASSACFASRVAASFSPFARWDSASSASARRVGGLAHEHLLRLGDGLVDLPALAERRRRRACARRRRSGDRARSRRVPRRPACARRAVGAPRPARSRPPANRARASRPTRAAPRSRRGHPPLARTTPRS